MRVQNITRGLAVGLVFALAVTGAVAGRSRRDLAPRPAASLRKQLKHAYVRSPMAFEVNRGQTDSEVKFLSRGSGYALFLAATEVVLVLSEPERSVASPRPGALLSGNADALLTDRLRARGRASRTVLRMRFLGANLARAISGIEPLAGRSNYLHGADRRAWRTGIPQYGKVRYRDVYPGIDLLFYGNQRQLEYDFVIAPGADPKRIRLGFAGAERIDLSPGGDLLLHTRGGVVRQGKPLIYQEVRGRRRAIDGGYVLSGQGRVGFRVAAYDRNHSLVIDPTLAYSTFLGGTNNDQATSIDLDPVGNAFVSGVTSSADFPKVGLTAGGIHDDTLDGNTDAFVTKLNSTGSNLVYSTFLGGSADERGLGIAVDSLGSAYVTGFTTSDDFPTRNALQGSFGGNVDVFLTRLNQSGTDVINSTFIGGSGVDIGEEVALDPAGNAYLTGSNIGGDFPTVNAIQSSPQGGSDAFATKVNAAGTGYVYSTYLGGTNLDFGRGVAADASGNAYLSGFTLSSDFPTTPGAFDITLGGGLDGFVTRLNANGSARVYSTFLGGTGGENLFGIVVDSAQNSYVAGVTSSSDYPTVNAAQNTLGGGIDAAITKLNAAGSGLVYSTFLGGSGTERANDIDLDPSGNAYVTGSSVTSGDGKSIRGGPASVDAFVTKVSASGSSFVYSVLLGGSDVDQGQGIAVDLCGSAYVTGTTASPDFPIVLPPFQGSNFVGVRDGFVSKVGADTTPPPAGRKSYEITANGITPGRGTEIGVLALQLRVLRGGDQRRGRLNYRERLPDGSEVIVDSVAFDVVVVEALTSGQQAFICGRARVRTRRNIKVQPFTLHLRDFDIPRLPANPAPDIALLTLQGDINADGVDDILFFGGSLRGDARIPRF